MQCPKCAAEIDRVIVLSQCSQIGDLVGDRIDEYRELQVDGTYDIQCPECYTSLKDVVK